MVIVIECEACQSRYRLARSLFKESKAIRVKCRKCGGYIVVENPNLAETAPDTLPHAPRTVQEPPPRSEEPPSRPEEPPPRPEPPPPSPPPSSPSPAREEESMRAMADLLREIGAEPEAAPAPAGKAPEPHLPPPDRASGRSTPYPEPPDGSEALASVLEDLFKPSPTKGSGAKDDHRKPEPARPRQPRAAEEDPHERPPYRHPMFIAVAILWLLLLAGTAFVFGTGLHLSWFSPKRTWSPATPASDNAASAAEFDIREVNYFTDNAYDGGKLFAVTGTVVNLGEALTGGIRIRAMLMGKDNTVLSERVVFAGNRIDNTMLRHTKRGVVEDFLAQSVEKGSVNNEIPKGESIPFMAVFFDPPEKIESVLVKAVPAKGR